MQNIYTNLECRQIQRDGDIDYFLETLSYPVILELPQTLVSQIQFPKSRAVLVRTSPTSTRVTIHILRDIDLHSSFANFEVELGGRQLSIEKELAYVTISII